MTHMRRKTALLGTMTAMVSAAALTPAISAASADPAPTTTPPMMDNAIALRAMPRGTARFFRNMDGDLSVKLSITGVTPGSDHSVDVEHGTCPTTFRLGADVAPAGDVQANMGGQIKETIDLGPAAAPTMGRLALTVRQGLTGKVMDGGSNPLGVQGLACTQVPHQLGRHGKRLRLMPVSESGMPLHGWASYTYDANDTQSSSGQSVTVSIKATGFVPGSVHAAHVHSGTCANQGDVVVMLPDLTADAHGVISATDTVPVSQQPQGPLYINIHEGNMNTILSGGTPTLAFRPLLCGNLSQTQAASTPATGTMPMGGTTSTTPQPAPFSGTHS